MRRHGVDGSCGGTGCRWKSGIGATMSSEFVGSGKGGGNGHGGIVNGSLASEDGTGRGRHAGIIGSERIFSTSHGSSLKG